MGGVSVRGWTGAGRLGEAEGAGLETGTGRRTGERTGDGARLETGTRTMTWERIRDDNNGGGMGVREGGKTED